MTDQLMDARLRAAGEAWRASTEAVLDTPVSGEPVDVVATHPHRPRRLAWLTSAAVVVAALVAGGTWVLIDNRGSSNTTTESAADPSALLGTTWTESGSESSLVRPGFSNSDPPYPTTTELRFPDAWHVTVTHRCYVESGRVTISGNTLGVTDLIRDRTIKCATATGTDAANERWSYRVVDELLSGRPTWTIKDGQLTISDKSTSVTFDSVSSPASLTNVSWRLVGDRALVVRFQDGRVTVHSGGCPDSSGQVTVSGSYPYLDFSDVHFDDSFCPYNPRVPAARSSDLARVRAFLNGAVRWWISGGKLSLSMGEQTLTFTR